MMEVINPGSGQSSVLACWEKTPLIRELEQTVNFAERKYGDLMQQLHFYKKYYEKWSDNNKVNALALKRNKKDRIRQNSPASNISEKEAQEKSSILQTQNDLFCERIRSKISDANDEITQANRKISLNEAPARPMDFSMSNPVEQSKSSEYPSKTTKSDPAVGSKKEICASENKSEFTVAKKMSNKSMPTKNSPRRRTKSLQKYKIRSKSLPQGIWRKFGFGSYVDVFVSQPLRLEKTRSRITIKSNISRDEIKRKKSETNKMAVLSFKVRRPRSGRSLRSKKSKTSVRKDCSSTKLKKLEKSEVKLPVSVPSCQSFNITVSDFRKTDPAPSCNSIRDAISDMKDDIIDIKDDVKALEKDNVSSRKPNSVVSLTRKPIPFTICGSTSKSFNIGLNIQQVLSLIKHKKPTVSLQSVVNDNVRTTRSLVMKDQPDVSTLFFGRPSTSGLSQIGSEYCPARQDNEDCISIVTDRMESRSRCTILSRTQTARSECGDDSKLGTFVDPASLPKLTVLSREMNRPQRPEDVWVVEQPDTRLDCGRPRSRCTCFPTKQCVDYHKLLRQYTGWRLPSAKQDTLSNLGGYTSYRPRLTVTSCTRSNLYPIPSQEDCKYSASGDGHGNRDDIKIQLTKVHGDLISLNRKYSSLQEQIPHLDNYEANAELDALETELEAKEQEYKEVLKCYTQLTAMKEQVRSLRGKNISENLSVLQQQQQQLQRVKRDPFRPTPAMALTKVLRHIQGLQDKIKLVDTF